MNPRNISELVSEITRESQLISMICKQLEKSHRTASSLSEQDTIEKQLNSVYFDLKSITETID